MSGKTRADGWWYPYIFVAGFVVVIAVNGALAYFATSTFNGLETQNAYETGRLYNQTIAKEEAQKALGWTLTLASAPKPHDPPGAGYPADLVITAVGPDGRPLDGLRVQAEVRRPAVAGLDREVDLGRRDIGVYGRTVVLPEPGQWEVRILATRGQDEYRLRDRIFVK